MIVRVQLFCILCFVQMLASLPTTTWQKRVMCAEISVNTLEKILGPAFNRRYMSVDTPVQDKQTLTGGGKRGVNSMDDDFYVEDTFLEQVVDEPAWLTRNHVTVSKKKYGLARRRRNVYVEKQWHCQARLNWIDLGPDYFPRYMRSVTCLSSNCWFNMYKCVPRSFTVKLLRRKKGYCAENYEDGGEKVGVVDLPADLVELWVWEERAVNFCCDCRQV